MVAHPPKSLPPILHTIRRDAKAALSALVKHMFEGADDVLFGMAERSRAEDDRQNYFDSMRAVRLERASISDAFIAVFHDGFELTIQPKESPPDDDSDPDEAVENMSLLQDDDLEVSVAMTGIVSKVSGQFTREILETTARIDSICNAREITEQTNPIAPHQIANAFVQATVELDVDIKTRIILLKLFEQCAMDGLSGLYSEANNTLIEAGILPNFRADARKSTSNNDSQTPATQSPQPTDTVAESGVIGSGHDFSALQSLLAQARGPALPPQADAGPPLSTPELMSALAELQERGVNGPLDEAPQPIDLRHLVMARAGGSAMAQGDDDVLNLVEMLFNKILNDRNLAIPMKALVSRLQIPILKVAVMDKSFFSAPDHPARRFLNELCSASIGWSSNMTRGRDDLYDLIESTVLSVLNDFTDDIGLFAELAENFANSVVKDQKKSLLIEKRVKDTESAKAKTQAFKAIVQRVINQKVSGVKLPPELGHFVGNIWSRVLLYVCGKFGANSEEWQQTASTLDDLLWSAQPLTDVEDIDRREQGIPRLVLRLREGLSFINAGQEFHNMVGTIRDTLVEISQHDSAALDDQQAPPLDNGYEQLEEVVLTSQDTTEVPEFSPEPEYLEKIEQLAEGTWVEMTASDESTRCKLATILQPGGIYVFVNRRGMKVAERSKAGLAADLQRETLVLLDESQVFDRALEAVIGSLQEMHDGSVPPGAVV